VENFLNFSGIIDIFLISNFRPVLNSVFFLLGDSRASEFYMPTFRNTLFHLHRQVGILHTYQPMKMEQTESAYKIQTPGNYPEESIQQLLTSPEGLCWMAVASQSFKQAVA
jgi:hypothetical protein